MRFPAAWYQIEHTLSARLPALRPSQTRGLATWLYGTLLAGSACQASSTADWQAEQVGEAAIRQVLREFVWDGADKAAPCTTQVEVAACFAPLLAWVLDWWTDGRRLPLAVDVTNLRDDVAMLVVSVLYRGSAIPVAWEAVSTAAKAPDQARDRWAVILAALLARLWPVVPPQMQVLVVLDQGLRSPRLREQIRACGWHPLMRLPADTWVHPIGEAGFRPAQQLITPGHAWVGEARIDKQARTQVRATLVVVWDLGQQAPWVLLTDIRPRQVGVVWYALRMWIELGFRALQGVGWQWQRTRRTHLARVARHWLVLAVAMLWTLAVGTRAADALLSGRPPARVRRPPAPGGPVGNTRRYSIFARGRLLLQRLATRGRLWTALWLAPEPWPDPLHRLQITYHDTPP
jgi:hypothetical protein